MLHVRFFTACFSEAPTRGGALLDLLFTDVIREVRVGGKFNWHNHALKEFTISRDMSQSKSKIKNYRFRKANFHLLKKLMNAILWETAFKDVVTKRHWLQGRSLSSSRALYPQVQEIRQEKQESNMLVEYGCVLAELKNKKETHRQWKQGHTSCKQYRNTAQTRRDGIMTTKAQLEVNLGRDVKKK